jgi:hypothetical protein
MVRLEGLFGSNDCTTANLAASWMSKFPVLLQIIVSNMTIRTLTQFYLFLSLKCNFFVETKGNGIVYL